MKRNLLVMIAMLGALAVPAQAADIVGEWASVKPPQAPAPKPVTVDPKTTALLMLDFMKQNCGQRPRCVASLPAMKQLLAAARAAKASVIYSIIANSTIADVLPDVAAQADEPHVQSGPDKFMGSTLQPTLRQAGIKTVIVCGNSYQGATVGTASGAAQRGYQIILPVDCSAGEDVYREQYATFHLTKGGPVIVTSKVTATRSAMIKF